MNRSIAIAARLREVLLQGRWIANTNYSEQLLAVSFEQALYQVGRLNTIAALTFHINYYLKGLLHAFVTGQLTIRDRFSYALPALQTQEDWQQLVTDFLENAAAFADAIEQMEDAQLEKPFVKAQYGTYLRNIEGVIEHCYYHLGQIVLIRKMISETV